MEAYHFNYFPSWISHFTEIVSANEAKVALKSLRDLPITFIVREAYKLEVNQKYTSVIFFWNSLKAKQTYTSALTFYSCRCSLPLKKKKKNTETNNKKK